MKTKTKPDPHPYVGDGIRDHTGKDRCARPRCGLAESRRDVHQMPAVPEDVIKAEARLLGENEGDDE